MKENRQQQILSLIEREVKRAEIDTLLLVVDMINERMNARDRLLDNPEWYTLNGTMKGYKSERYHNIRTKLRTKNIEDCDILGKLWDRIIDLRERDDENK